VHGIGGAIGAVLTGVFALKSINWIGPVEGSHSPR
jgi:ammonia channel protein AmtB